MDWGVRIVVVAVAWVLAAVAMGLVVGRMIWRRDQQRPAHRQDRIGR